MTLSRRHALALPVLGLMFPGMALADTPPLAMVMNSGDASISIIDMNTR